MVDLRKAVFRTPSLRTVVVTSPNGRELLERNGVTLLLHEGGPALFGDFVTHGCMDELILAVAPQFAGRN
jgi:riboflavin biosynthesis pyrimidine reductase